MSATSQRFQASTSTLPEYQAPDEFIPNFILLISGKRKSGKDYIAGLIEDRLRQMGLDVGMLRMANPVKLEWANLHGADFGRMLDSGSYKEVHRPGMAQLSIETRTKSIGYFPYHSIIMDKVLGKWIWICPDMRHTQDIDWFYKYYPGIVKKIRVEASEDVRKGRGFTFVQEIDTGGTECELDGLESWDLVIVNDDTGNDVQLKLETIISWILAAINPKNTETCFPASK